MEEYHVSFIKRTITEFYVPGTVINYTAKQTESGKKFDGLLMAEKRYDPKNPDSQNLVALLGTKELPLYAGQRVIVRGKQRIDEHDKNDLGRIVYESSDFELVTSRPDVANYGDCIRSLVDVKGDISKLILHEPMKEDFSNFPLMLVFDPSLPRETKELASGYPNTIFEVPAGNGAVMVGYLYNNHSMFPRRKQRLEKAGYQFREMTFEFAEKLKDTQIMVPLTEEIARVWGAKIEKMPQQLQQQ